MAGISQYLGGIGYFRNLNWFRSMSSEITASSAEKSELSSILLLLRNRKAPTVLQRKMLSALVRVAARAAAIQLEEAAASSGARHTYKGKERAVQDGPSQSLYERLDLRDVQAGKSSKQTGPLQSVPGNSDYEIQAQSLHQTNQSTRPASSATSAPDAPPHKLESESSLLRHAVVPPDDLDAKAYPSKQEVTPLASKALNKPELPLKRSLDEVVAAELSSPGAGSSKLPETAADPSITVDQVDTDPISEVTGAVDEDDDVGIFL